jgi:hypothetical protein
VYDGRTEQRNRLEYWLDHVRNYGGDAPTWVLINMFDKHKPEVSRNTLKSRYPFIKDFVDFSIKKDKSALKNFRNVIEEFIRSNPSWNNQIIPSSYFAVKSALESHFQQNQDDYIDIRQYRKIANGVGIDKEKHESLLLSLSDLGICLWYKDIAEFDTLVLNPNWTSNGIYKVINWAHNKEQAKTNNKPKPVVSIRDFAEIFRNDKDKYPASQFQYILTLMIKYELAYPKKDDVSIVTIPHLLNEDQPEKLPTFEVGDSLMIKYVASSPLPPYTVCRLIVRQHQKIRSEEEVWRYGVVLQFAKDTVALVYEEDRTVVIKVKGSQASACIAELRDTMDDIFNSYKANKPELQYRIIETVQRESELFLSDQTIKGHIEGRRDYYDPQEGKDIPLTQTAQAYNINVSIYGDVNVNMMIFHKCNIQLQEDLNSLIKSLGGKHKEVAEIIRAVLDDLKQAEQVKSKEEITNRGLLTKLKDLIIRLGDENSDLRKILNGLVTSVQIIKSIIDAGNTFLKWF